VQPAVPAEADTGTFRANLETSPAKAGILSRNMAALLAALVALAVVGITWVFHHGMVHVATQPAILKGRYYFNQRTVEALNKRAACSFDRSLLFAYGI
jgi:hypothetical protein